MIGENPFMLDMKIDMKKNTFGSLAAMDEDDEEYTPSQEKHQDNPFSLGITENPIKP